MQRIIDRLERPTERLWLPIIFVCKGSKPLYCKYKKHLDPCPVMVGLGRVVLPFSLECQSAPYHTPFALEIPP